MADHTAVPLGLLAELTRRTGLRIHDGPRERLARVLHAHADVIAGASWRGTLDRHLEFEDALADVVAIDETYFFRHHDQLAHLRSRVLPRLLAERDQDHVLQVWSAGCADGEEPYTLAMILAEEGLGERSAVLGTDLTLAALDRARSATYSRWSLRSPEIRGRGEYFERVSRNRFRLSPEVTERVTFQRHNLLDPRYPRPPHASGFDVILCRNVLLHLTPEAIATVVPQLTAALSPGGWLITAPADPSPLGLPGTEDLDGVVLASGGVIYRRRDGDSVEIQQRGPSATSAAAGPADPPGRPAAPSAARRRARRTARPTPARTTPALRPTVPAPGGTAPTDGRSRCAQARTLLAAGRPADALPEAMAAAFLAPDLPAAHLTLALSAAAVEQHQVASRAFRRASELLEALPPDEPVELCDGETARALADLVRAHALLYTEPAA